MGLVLSEEEFEEQSEAQDLRGLVVGVVAHSMESIRNEIDSRVISSTSQSRRNIFQNKLEAIVWFMATQQVFGETGQEDEIEEFPSYDEESFGSLFTLADVCHYMDFDAIRVREGVTRHLSSYNFATEFVRTFQQGAAELGSTLLSYREINEEDRRAKHDVHWPLEEIYHFLRLMGYPGLSLNLSERVSEKIDLVKERFDLDKKRNAEIASLKERKKDLEDSLEEVRRVHGYSRFGYEERRLLQGQIEEIKDDPLYHQKPAFLYPDRVFPVIGYAPEIAGAMLQFTRLTTIRNAAYILNSQWGLPVQLFRAGYLSGYDKKGKLMNPNARTEEGRPIDAPMVGVDSLKMFIGETPYMFGGWQVDTSFEEGNVKLKNHPLVPLDVGSLHASDHVSLQP